MKRKPLIILSLTLAVIIFVAIIAYIFLPKQSDSDYRSLRQSITDIKNSKELVSLDVSSIGLVALITEDFTSRYTKHVSDLSKATKSLDENPLLAKDTDLKEVYDQYKNDMRSYITSNTNLLSSIKSYAAVSAACSDMGYTLDQIRTKGSPMTAAVFSSNAKDCQDAITTSESASDAQFNDQFFAAYLSELGALVDAYRQEFSATNATAKNTARAAVEKTWDDILSMNNTSLVLTRSPDPSESLNKLDEAANK